MERLSLEDDYYIRIGGNETPVVIGGLLLFERPAEGRFIDRVRAQFSERLPRTPLPRVLRFAPFNYDLPVWLDAGPCDLSYHLRPAPEARSYSHHDLLRLVEERYLEPLDPKRPPFLAYVVDEVDGGRSAIFLKVHHSMFDGIGFVTAISLLLDPLPDYAPPMPKSIAAESTPFAALWLLRSSRRLRKEAAAEKAPSPARTAAQAAFDEFRENPATRTPKTPQLIWPPEISNARAFATVSLPLADFRAVAQKLSGTVNDVYMAVVGGAVRAFLQEMGALPELPLVARVPRSRRKPEHGLFGNHLMAIYPTLATDSADPLERFRRIQESLRLEIQKSRLREPLQSDYSPPWGPRKTDKAMRQTRDSGGAVTGGNVTVSNVPGPAETLSLQGCALLANYPAPILSTGKFLNVTMRRYRDKLDIGIMGDREKTPDVERFAQFLTDSLRDLTSAVGTAHIGATG